MRRMRWIAVSLTLALLTVGAAAPASAHPRRVRPHPVYLALGDSWAYGEGATDPATDGYVPQLEEVLEQELDCNFLWGFHRGRKGCEQLELVNLARPATETLPGVTAPLVASEQLPIALPMLWVRNHDWNPRNDVEVVTLQVGGNDVSGPIQAACIGGTSTDCLTTFVTEMTTFEADLDNVVRRLRRAAGPDTPIVLGTYDPSPKQQDHYSYEHQRANERELPRRQDPVIGVCAQFIEDCELLLEGCDGPIHRDGRRIWKAPSRTDKTRPSAHRTDQHRFFACGTTEGRVHSPRLDPDHDRKRGRRYPDTDDKTFPRTPLPVSPTNRGMVRFLRHGDQSVLATLWVPGP